MVCKASVQNIAVSDPLSTDQNGVEEESSITVVPSVWNEQQYKQFNWMSKNNWMYASDEKNRLYRVH